MFTDNGYFSRSTTNAILKARRILLLMVLGLVSFFKADAQFTVSFDTSDYHGFNISCHGGNDGTIFTNMQGGVVPFTFLWSNGSTFQNLAGLSVGTYTVTVTDDNSFQQTEFITIIEPAAISISVTSITNVTCYAGSDGEGDITVAGGIFPYKYVWSNGTTLEDISGVGANNYVVTVTDANSCSSSSVFDITEPDSITINLTKADVTCNGVNDGTITTAASGGTGTLTYLWSNGSTNQNQNGLSAITYTVTVTDAAGCSNQKSTVISQPSAITPNPLIQNVSCHGGTNGIITISATGGTGTLSYLWNDNSAVGDHVNLIAGDYTITITDITGCSKIFTYTVTQPDSLIIDSAVTNVSCFGGSNGAIDISVSGGTGAYTYLWSNGSSTQDQTNLTSNTYSVTVTDSLNCTAQLSFVVSQPAILAVSGSVTNLLCNGVPQGAINITASGGIGVLSFLWSNGSTTEDQSTIIADTYTVTATDVNSCTALDTFIVTQPDSVLINGSAANANCNGDATGSITITASGGTGTLTYLWSNGSTIQNQSGLVANTYIVTVTDANSCSKLKAFTVSQPDSILITGVVADVRCYGQSSGSIDLSATGGTGTLTYLWSNASTASDQTNNLALGFYTVTVTDANGCSKIKYFQVIQPDSILITGAITDVSCNGGTNGAIDIAIAGGIGAYTYLWSNSNTAEDQTTLIIGTFTITATDVNGCIGQQSFLVTEPNAIALSFNPTDAVCNQPNGSITALPSGGTGLFTYLWNAGATTSTINNLAANTYTVTVTDQNGCIFSQSVSISNEGSPVISSFTISRVVCNGQSNGAIDIMVLSGQPLYTYLWSNSASSEDITAVAAGNYTVTVSDANLCTTSASYTVTQPSSLTAPAVITNVSCNGGNNAAIDVTAQGGTSPYTYSWNNGNTTQDLTSIVAANYTIVVTDTNNCTRQRTFIITEPDSISIIGAITNVNCNGTLTGAIDLTDSGGTGTLSFLWSNASTAEDQTALGATTYTVTVTDVNSCTNQKSFTVSQPAVLAITGSTTNVGCNGALTGAININITGGTGSRTYLWSNGSTAKDQSNLSANTYTVTVTDSLGCTNQQLFTVNQATAINISGTITHVTCYGLTNGSIDITASGGSGPLTYAWSNNTFTEDQTNIAANTYTVTVTDSIGCLAQASFTVTQPDSLLITGTVTQINCNGANNGAIDITVSGGTIPYSFLWSNSSVNEDQINLLANIYTVTVTDTLGCSFQKSFAINQPAALTITGIVTNVTCFGETNGSIDITATGGSGTLTYVWSNSTSTEDQINIAATTYTVTVTDSLGCTDQHSFTVSQPDSISISGNITNVNCNGGATGAIDITVTGGTGSYTYLWNTANPSSQDQTTLIANTYTVTVTDSLGCSKQKVFVLSQALPVSITGVVTNDSCFGGSTGALNITATGGTGGFTFLWSNSSTVEDQANLAATIYTVTATDNSGCIGQQSFTVTQPQQIIISGVVTNVSCNSGSNGAIDITATGGTGTFTYLWNNGSTNEDRTNLIFGTYTVTATDVNGCTGLQTFTVTQPQPIAATFTNVDESCNNGNGILTINPSGGNGGYTYLWSNGFTTQTINNLIPATYTVTVTDSLSCTNQFSTVINAISGLVITLDSMKNVSCNGGNNGAVYISVSGGAQPYSYLWSNAQTTQDISGLVTQQYIVTVTDSNSCVESDTFFVFQPTALAATFIVHNAACAQTNGSATVNASGGLPSYTYLWSNNTTLDSISPIIAGNYSVTVTDANSCTQNFGVTIGNDAGPTVVVDSITNVTCNTGSNGAVYTTASGGTGLLQYLWSNFNTTGDITNLQANSYIITVTDARGCIAKDTAIVSQPNAISLSFNSTTATCNSNNGTAQVTPLGGTPGYLFLWNNSQTTATIQNLFAGIYTVTVTDTLGCVKSDTITIANSGIPQISLFNQTNVSCNGGTNGSVTVSASNGIAPYSYVWSNGDASATADTLSATTYTVTVTDSVGCSTNSSYSITQPTAITLQFVITPEPCNNGQGGAIVTPSGGISGYSYLWSNGDIDSAITNVTAGNYTVTVSDQNNCTLIQTTTITGVSAPNIAVTSVTNVTCYGDSTGSINITVTNGTQPFIYAWSNTQTTQDIDSLVAGNYFVTIIDSNNCQDTLTIPISEPLPIVIRFTAIQATCNNANGNVSTVVSGGAPNYTYLWSTGATTSGITNVLAGVYTLTVTDANNCMRVDTDTVTNINGPIASTQSMDSVTCNGGSNGALNIIVSQGIGPFTFLWSNNSTMQNISNVAAGIYCVTVTDSNGCAVVYCDTVLEPLPMSVAATVTNASCNINNGIITITPVGGIPNYSYTWSTGAHSSTISSLAAGTIYTVTVTDGNTCSIDSSFTLTNSGNPFINVVSTVYVTCYGGTNGAIDISVNGGVSTYQFNWSNNEHSEDIDTLTAGVYTVTVTDFVGCTSTQLFTIIEPPEIQITFPVIQNANCNQSNGMVVVDVAGGTPGYNFLWSNNSTNDTIANLPAASYMITVTDGVGCTKTAFASVSNLNGPSITNTISTNVLCAGGADGSISITANGGAPPLTYSWTNNPATTPAIDNLSANTYTITVRDDANCLAVTSITVTEPPPFHLVTEAPLLNPPYNLSCFHSNDGAINLNVTGATPPYILIWSNGSNADTIQNLSANTYSIVITDSHQCTTSASFTLTEPPQLTANAGSNFAICGEYQTTLNAIPSAIGIGYWQVINGDGTIVFADSTSPVSIVSNLPVGDNYFQWTIVNGTCADSAVVVVTTASSITAIPGVDRIICGSTTDLDATRPQFGYGYWIALNGSPLILDSTNALTGVQNLSYGTTLFQWIVSNGLCRDTGTISVLRRDSIECLSLIEIPTAFSPNSDGHNDVFEIKGIQDYPENNLLVYNRWGKVVNEYESYHNQWDGSDNKGNELADGTYFIILKVRGINDVFKSFVDLRR